MPKNILHDVLEKTKLGKQKFDQWLLGVGTDFWKELWWCFPNCTDATALHTKKSILPNVNYQ